MLSQPGDLTCYICFPWFCSQKVFERKLLFCFLTEMGITLLSTGSGWVCRCCCNLGYFFVPVVWKVLSCISRAFICVREAEMRRHRVSLPWLSMLLKGSVGNIAGVGGFRYHTHCHWVLACWGGKMAMAVQEGMAGERGWPSCRKASTDGKNKHTLETRDGKKSWFGCNCEWDPWDLAIYFGQGSLCHNE